jgi:precorrin-6Y C5,15-methyltransferase (decarboxylating)
MKPVTVIGLGDHGCAGLSSVAYGKIEKAQVLVGGERHLEFFPQFNGKKLTFQNGLMKTIEEVKDLSHEHHVVVLASGDPLFYGVGDLLGRKVGREFIEFLPHLSSVQLAFARIGVKYDDACTISIHGRPIKGLVNRLQREHKVALLTDSDNSPERIGVYLKEYGEDQNWEMVVCENLEGPDEKVSFFKDLNSVEGGFSPLNVCLLLRKDKRFRPVPFSIHSEDEFQKRLPKKGLITKKEVRAISLMNMDIRPDSCVWDVGAGSGSVSVEAAQFAYSGNVVAIETDPVGVDIIHENIRSFKTDNVEVYHGMALDVFQKEDLQRPDAVFIGGTKGGMKEIISHCYHQLNVHGKMVVSAITLENISLALATFKELNLKPEVQLVQISRGKAIAHLMRYDALNPIHLFTVKKEEESEE